jgi:hypothetical protein
MSDKKPTEPKPKPTQSSTAPKPFPTEDVNKTDREGQAK